MLKLICNKQTNKQTEIETNSNLKTPGPTRGMGSTKEFMNTLEKFVAMFLID